MSRFQGLGFRGWGLGFGVWGLGFGIEGRILGGREECPVMMDEKMRLSASEPGICTANVQ